VFVADTADGAQLYYYYPQLSIAGQQEEGTFEIDNAGAAGLKGF
jgi:hypothetical protein